MGDGSRAMEKFSRAVHEMATGDGSIQQRLADAGYHIFAAFVEEDLPEELQENYRVMLAELTKVANTDIGSIRATASTLSDEDAKMWASRIVSMTEDIWRRWGVDDGLRQAQRELDSVPEVGGVS